MSLTPMMQQYLDIKSEHSDALLMFRLGDFYELFFDDALTASKVLEITLTGREAGSAGRVPMCGVPFHAVDQYITKLIDRGFRVAICEQTEDPKQTKGLVKREVVRVVTPGTVMRDDGQANRYLAAIVHYHGQFAVALVDVNTGEVFHAQLQDEEVLTGMLYQWGPTELLIPEGASASLAYLWLEEFKERATSRISYVPEMKDPEQVLCRQYSVPNLQPLDLHDTPLAAEACAVAIDYVHQTQKQILTHLRTPRDLNRDRFLMLDYTAVRNLELVETMRTRQRKGSLLGLLDRTSTAMGSRTLRQWIERPLQDVHQIEERLDAVDIFVMDLFLRGNIQALLEQVYDLDRLSGRVSFGTANARDLLALAQSLEVLPQIGATLKGLEVSMLERVAHEMPDLSALAAKIRSTLVEEPPVSVRDGGLIQRGIHPALDELRDINLTGKAWLAELERREREVTGIKTLKVGYNKVFGYYLEISKGNAHLAPAHYERRQTLASAERYVIPELKEHEASILNAEERSLEMEYALFVELREQVLAVIPEIQRSALFVREVDAIVALASVAAENRFVRPEITMERGIHIVRGRHPVVEVANPGKFVPNDVELNEARQLLLITGPNMAGKSTYMRQNAIIILMAHMGSFVPADAATIGIVDRIFTRIGASDDVGAGQSTFMVEMVELAQILRQATKRSFVLLDEIGRGTSTYDGLSIAEAVMEALQAPDLSPFTLFATHYHELTETAERFDGVANCSVLVSETDEGIAFLHTVVDRPADKSYGIQVARLAGIPSSVIDRAQSLLQEREQPFYVDVAKAAPMASDEQRPSGEVAVGLQAPSSGGQMELFGWAESEWLATLAQLDVLRMTPLEALNQLHKVVEEAKEMKPWGKF